MHGRKGYVLIITLLVSSLILTMALYALTSAEKECERVSINKSMLNKGYIRDREYLLTEAYNIIKLNGEDINSIKEYLNSHSIILSDSSGGVYYDKDQDLIYVKSSFNYESYILSYYNYFCDKLSFSLKYTKLSNKFS